MSTIFFLAWAPYSMRAESISCRLGASLHTLSYKSRRKFYAPIKYPLLFYKTLRLLTSSTPTTIICQSPPIFCPLTVMVYAVVKRNKKIRIIVDAHTATFEKPWSHPILNNITKRVIRKALIVIVANAELQEIVSQNYGVKPLVLEDGVPQIHNDVQEDSLASVDRGGKYAKTHLPNTMRSQDGVKVMESEGGM